MNPRIQAKLERDQEQRSVRTTYTGDPKNKVATPSAPKEPAGGEPKPDDAKPEQPEAHQ